jgi:hypothetical protein
MEDCYPINIPMNAKIKLPAADPTKAIDKHEYRQMVGALLFLSTSSRPDISYAVNMVARYSEGPQAEHWIAIKEILKYLKGTIKFGLWMGKSNDELVVWSDADWANDQETRKSVSGTMVKVWGCPVIWSSRQQSIVATSTTLAEIVAACTAVTQGEQFKMMLEEIGIKSDQSTSN